MDNERTTINLTKGTLRELNKFKVNNGFRTLEDLLLHLLKVAAKDFK